MGIEEKNKIKVLFHLKDGEDHRDSAIGLTREQYYVACQELHQQGCIHFVSTNVGVIARIKDKGRGVLDNFIQEQKYTDMMNINEMEEDEKKLILYLGDSDKYASYYADIEEDYNEIFDDLLFGGYVKYGETADDMDSLTRKGKKLFNLIESEMNKLTDLDWMILNVLVKHEKPIFDIRCEDPQLQVYSDEEITNSCVKLKSMGLVDFFYDDNDGHKSHWFKIEDNGRIFVRNNKQQNNENIVLEERIDNNDSGDDDGLYDFPDDANFRVKIAIMKTLFKAAGIDIYEEVESNSGGRKTKYNKTDIAKIILYLIADDSLSEDEKKTLFNRIKKELSSVKPLDRDTHGATVADLNKLMKKLSPILQIPM